MENPAQYIPMDNTTRLIIILGLLVPFVIDTITETFMRNRTAKIVIQCICSGPAFVAYGALLGFLLQNNMPGSFVILLLMVGGFAVYVFAYHLAAWGIQHCFAPSYTIVRSDEPRFVPENDPGTASVTSNSRPVSSPKSTAIPEVISKTPERPPVVKGTSEVSAKPVQSASYEIVATHPTVTQKPIVPQTLKTCLRCAKALSDAKCRACGLDHAKEAVSLLIRVDPRDLQIKIPTE